MKYYRILLVLFLIIGYVFGQGNIPIPPPPGSSNLANNELNKYEDEVTRIDVSSSDYLASKKAGVWLIGLEPSECENFDESRRFNNRIIYKTLSNDTLRIAVNFVTTCCVNFLGNIQVLDDTLNLTYIPTGDFCDCSCCYSLEYAIKISRKFDHFKLNNRPVFESDEKYQTFPIQFEIVNGDTINMFNKYKERVGIHIRFNEKGDTLTLVDFLDNRPIEIKDYYSNGQIKRWFKKTFLSKNENPSWAWPYKTRLREWNEKGLLIKDEKR